MCVHTFLTVVVSMVRRVETAWRGAAVWKREQNMIMSSRIVFFRLSVITTLCGELDTWDIRVNQKMQFFQILTIFFHTLGGSMKQIQCNFTLFILRCPKVATRKCSPWKSNGGPLGTNKLCIKNMHNMGIKRDVSMSVYIFWWMKVKKWSAQHEWRQKPLNNTINVMAI